MRSLSHTGNSIKIRELHLDHCFSKCGPWTPGGSATLLVGREAGDRRSTGFQDITKTFLAFFTCTVSRVCSGLF